MPLAAMLASLTARADPGRPLVIHALGYDLPTAIWNNLTSSLDDRRVQWHRIDVDVSELLARGFRTRPHDHVSIVTYFRLLLPELLPPTVEKVLYLDSDLIVREDISALWDTDIAAVDFAAAPERDAAAQASSRRGIRFYRDLGLKPQQAIFNVGVLLINLRRWRQSQLALRAFVYLRCLGHELRWYEQDALNVVANGSYLELDPRWNVPPREAGRGSHASAAIVHYLTAHKPWHWDYSWPQRELFFEALDRTAWAGWRPLRPRLGRPKRLIRKVSKAVLKRRHALSSAWRSLGRDVSYRLLAPQPLQSGHRALSERRGGRGGAEIRLFLAVPCVNVALGRVLEAYGHAGVDRAVVLDRSGTGNPAQLLPAPRIPLHLFGCGEAPPELGLRRLLDRYGERHWCVLGDGSRLIVDEGGSPIALREYCARLDLEGVDVAEAVTGPGQPIELIGRDLRSGRVFRSTALARCPAQAYDPPVFGSRAVLLRYRKTMLLDAGAVLVGNARRSIRFLWFNPPPPPPDSASTV